jgi:hypothetical protein
MKKRLSTNQRLRLVQSNLARNRVAGKLKYDRSVLNRMTLMEMKAATPPEVKDRSFKVRITRRHYETGRYDGFRKTKAKYPTIYNQVRIYSRDTSKEGSGKQHKSLIRFFGPPNERTPCWVWCDCAYFTYTLEFALDRNNSSSIKNSNGEPADVRNPGNATFLCKHLYRASEWALTRKEDKATKAMDRYIKDMEGKKSASSPRSAMVPGKRFGR